MRRDLAVYNEKHESSTSDVRRGLAVYNEKHEKQEANAGSVDKKYQVRTTGNAANS